MASEMHTYNRKLTAKRLQESPLWPRIKARVVEVGECMEWIGAYSNNGHLPSMRRNYKAVPARRLIAEALGVDLTGKRIHMACGNHRCINPAHYKVLDMSDALKEQSRIAVEARTRHTYIANPGNIRRRKLTPEQVQYIRTSSESSYKLAEMFGVSAVAIRNARRMETYQDVGVVGMWSQLLRRAA